MKNTSRKSNGSSKASKAKEPIEGPFDPTIEAQARKLSAQYRVVLQKGDGDGFVGTCLEIPTVFSTGKTANACVEATYKALTVAVATMLEAGVTPPQPLTERKRTEQMNVRLDGEEKLVLRSAAKRRGYRSASDYVRAVALRDARAQS